MKTHDLKILPEFYQAVKNGEKTFEVRKNDRDFKKYDVIILREWDGEKYTGRWLERSIGYILPGGAYGIEDGYVVLALKRGRPTACLD